MSRRNNPAKLAESASTHNYIDFPELLVGPQNSTDCLCLICSHLEAIKLELQGVMLCSDFRSEVWAVVFSLVDRKIGYFSFQVPVYRVQQFACSGTYLHVLQSLSFFYLCLDGSKVTMSFFQAAFSEEARGSSM